jgi:hypothetical protein
MSKNGKRQRTPSVPKSIQYVRRDQESIPDLLGVKPMLEAENKQQR